MIKCLQCGRDNPQNSKFCNDCGTCFTGEGTGKLNPDTVLEGRYIIVKTIGRGGMGAVYLALDSRLNNMPVAIKEMSTQAVGGDLQAAIASFQKEAALLISLRHPSLPVIRDFFSRSENRWYLVMDYIEGQTLKQFVDQNGPVPEAQVLDWGKQLCNILDYLHNQSPPIIFRDLKPSNIMLTPQGQIKLIDFGIARHFRQGISTDTAAYGSSGFAPPEQYGQNQTDPRADIYALGATLHYLLTGIDPSMTPFNFESPSKHVKVSPRMENAIMKALDLKAENRPRDARELLSMLPQGKVRHASGSKSNSSNIKQDIKAAKDITADLPATTPTAGADNITKPEQKSESKTAPLATSQIDREIRPQPHLYEQVVTQPLQSVPSGVSKKSVASSPAASAKINKTRNIIIAACLVLALFAGGAYGYGSWRGNDKHGPGVVDATDTGLIPRPDPPGESPDDTGEETPTEADIDNEGKSKNISPQKIVFNDPALEKAIREAINKPTGEITKEDVKDIRELSLAGKEIKNLSGLENLTNLTSLYLSYNPISDISPLQNLTNLTDLDLGVNQIIDISPLQNLTNLTDLGLGNNQISDISPLQNLINLEILYLGNNQISDISPLQNLTNLTCLCIRGNPISDYSPASSYYHNLKAKDFEL